MKTLVQSPLPRFRTFLEGIFWDLFELRRRSHFDGIDIRKMASLQNSFYDFFFARNIAILEYPSYFPDLAPCDFFLFLKIKSVLKGTHFSDIDSIKMAATTEVKKIPENTFQECFKSWKRQMHKCFQEERDYFEEFDFGIFQYFSIKFL